MPHIEVAAPMSSASADRLALGVQWVRPGVSGIGGTPNPLAYNTPGCGYGTCFEGNEE